MYILFKELKMNEQLKEYFAYAADTGVIIWIKVAKNAKYKVGDIAGTINREGSLSITCLGKNYLAHKLAWWLQGCGEYNDTVIHLNKDRADNRLCNLELAYSSRTLECTQDNLKKLFIYNEETGVFTTRVATKLYNNIGEVAGTKNGRGYLQFLFAGKLWLAHRLAFLYMTGEIPNIVDHIDMNPSNNAWNNIRACTISENACNAVHLRSILGVKGITKYPKGTGYLAQVTKDGVVYRKGYRTQEEAETWLKETRERLHGEFARH
jgi:hypothetical protein